MRDCPYCQGTGEVGDLRSFFRKAYLGCEGYLLELIAVPKHSVIILANMED